MSQCDVHSKSPYSGAHEAVIISVLARKVRDLTAMVLAARHWKWTIWPQFVRKPEQLESVNASQSAECDGFSWQQTHGVIIIYYYFGLASAMLKKVKHGVLRVKSCHQVSRVVICAH